MPTHFRDPVLTCDGCGATASRPADAAWRPLHDQGWRWIGNPSERPARFAPKTSLVSCPGCPSVIRD